MQVQLGDIITWSKGVSIPRDDTSVAKEIPYLHYGDLYQKYDFRLDLDEQYDDIIKISPSPKIKPEQLLHDGDIVFTLTSETVDDLGHCTLISNPNDYPFVSGMETTVIHITDKERVFPSYLNYLFHTIDFQRHLRTFVTGMKVYRVHPNDMMKMMIELPEYTEQIRIVSLLDPLSDLIKINNQVNDYLLDLIFTEFNHVSKKLLTHYVPLMDLCTFISRGVSPKYVDDSDYWVLGQTCIRNHVVTLDNARTLVSKDYGEKAVHKGDILVNSTGIGSLGRVAQLWFDHPKLVVDSHISIVRPQPVYQEYLGCYLMSIENEIENMAEGSTGQTELPRKSLMQITVPLPEDSIVESFNKRVRPLFNMINNNLESNRTLSSIRETLLPKLLSGQVN